MHSYEQSLARLRDGRYYAKKAERPFTLKTDSGVALEVPGPLLLASVYAEAWLTHRVEAYRFGAAILVRPRESEDEPLPLLAGTLADELLQAMRALPELSTQEAGRPYRDLRVFLSEALPTTRAKYLADVISHLRTLLPEYRPPKPKVERPPAKTASERLAAHRARRRHEEELSARDWLTAFLSGSDGEEQAPSPGSRWSALGLYKAAAEAIEDFIDCDEERFDGGDYVLPRQRVFYAEADKLLGPRRRGAKGSAMLYTIPDASDPS